MRDSRSSQHSAFLVALLSGFLAWLPIAQAQTPTPLKVGAVRYIGEALTFLADEKGFFRDQGLEVQLLINSSGSESLAQLVRGELDLATLAPLPIVFAAIDQLNPGGQATSPFVIVANTMQSSRINFVLARTDRGIRQPRDLEGKTLALSFGTASEYFWYAFALHYDVDATKVRVVDVAMRDMRKAFEAGAVDAVVVWEPNIEDIRRRTAAPTVVMGGTQIYVTDWLLLARHDYAKRNTAVVTRYLRALIAAERIVQTDPAAAARVHATRIGMPEESVLRLFRSITFNVSLDEALLVNLELQGRWALEHKRAGKGRMPVFRDLVFDSALRTARPDSVNVLR